MFLRLRALQDVRQLIDVQRLIKSPYEQAIMRLSGNIAAGAHNRAMQFVKPNHERNMKLKPNFCTSFIKMARNRLLIPASSQVVPMLVRCITTRIIAC